MIFKCRQTYIYIYINIDRGGTKKILGPAGVLRAPTGKSFGKTSDRDVYETVGGSGWEYITLLGAACADGT